jgi:hypothetical protein
MSQSAAGRGYVVPTGKHAPCFGVRYEISHNVTNVVKSNGIAVKVETASAQIATLDSNHAIPLGDFDLIVNDEIIRLKHVSDDPEWLVLSSRA